MDESKSEAWECLATSAEVEEANSAAEGVSRLTTQTCGVRTLRMHYVINCSQLTITNTKDNR